MFALRAIELIGASLERAYKKGDDVDAREGMQIGATLAMIATINSRLGLCHALAMPLCALYHLPHGQACGIVLPSVLTFNAEAVPGKARQVFRSLGYGEDDFARLDQLVAELGLKVSLEKDFGYKEAHMDTIVKGTMESFQTLNNPRNVTERDVRNIVRKLL
jgi:alcohol dehydrogenase